MGTRHTHQDLADEEVDRIRLDRMQGDVDRLYARQSTLEIHCSTPGLNPAELVEPWFDSSLPPKFSDDER
jgi:hypothetical protein